MNSNRDNSNLSLAKLANLEAHERLVREELGQEFPGEESRAQWAERMRRQSKQNAKERLGFTNKDYKPHRIQIPEHRKV